MASSLPVGPTLEEGWEKAEESRLSPALVARDPCADPTMTSVSLPPTLPKRAGGCPQGHRILDGPSCGTAGRRRHA